MSIIKWWWLDTTKFGVICYIAVDYQNGKVERPDKNSKLPLERKLSFEVFFFFFGLLEKVYGMCKHYSVKLILYASVHPD